MHRALFSTLSAIARLDFEASSGPGSKMGWNHRGSGTVQVMVDGSDIHFTDSFTLDNGTPCLDRKCWRFTDEGIIFRHYRQQQFLDILLFPWPATPAGSGRSRAHTSLWPSTDSAAPSGHDAASHDASLPLRGHVAESGPILLATRSPYLCPPDTYDGTLRLNGSTLTLSLRITGTRKDESIRYTYTPAA
ncbi:MAG: hypothetical protein Q4D19_05935 [Lautropia sp.]|nr:hypothetical protein [Lautropia sp.]